FGPKEGPWRFLHDPRRCIPQHQLPSRSYQQEELNDLQLISKNQQPAGFNLGEIEEAVDQVQEMFRANQNLLKILFLKSRYLPFGPPQHQAGEADNGIERRAQLVTDVGEKLRLVPVSGLKQRV